MFAPVRAGAFAYMLLTVLAACSTSDPGLRIQTDDVPAGSLRVAQVVAIAKRQTILDPQFDTAHKAINAAGVADSDLVDGSVVAARIYCCGGMTRDSSAEVAFTRHLYVPKDMKVDVGDFVEVRVGRPPEKGDGGRLNTVTRLVAKRTGEPPHHCWWDPRQEGLWLRTPYCDWMQQEGWKKQGGSSPAWYKPSP